MYQKILKIQVQNPRKMDFKKIKWFEPTIAITFLI